MHCYFFNTLIMLVDLNSLWHWCYNAMMQITFPLPPENQLNPQTGLPTPAYNSPVPLYSKVILILVFTTRTLFINIIVRMINVHDQFCLILWTLFNFRRQDNLAEALAENPGFVQVETICFASTPFFTFDIKCQFPEINSLEVCIALGNHGQWKYHHFYYYHVFFQAPKPSLPTVNTATISKPHESETFRVRYNLWNYVK